MCARSASMPGHAGDMDNGLSRGSRSLPALAPSTAPIDARTPAQLMQQALAYARLLNYFDAHGVAPTDWQAFWDSDVTFRLAQAACWPDQPLPPRAEPADKLLAIHAMLGRLRDWYEGARLADARFLVQSGNPLLGTAAAMLDTHQARLNAVLQADAQAAAPDGDSLGALAASLNDAGRRLRAQAMLALERACQRDDHPAHTALYLAFLRLYAGVQSDLNAFTGRHLDYYYDTVLRLKPAAGVADELTLIVSLAANCSDHVLPARAIASPGQDSQGQPVLYATDCAVALNQISIGDIRTVLYQRDAGNGSIAAVYAAPVANSQDGLGQPLAEAAAGWPTFGAVPPPDAREALTAGIGMLLTAPSLQLAEGVRALTLRLSFAIGAEAIEQAFCPPPPSVGTGAPAAQVLPAETFLLSMSSASGWLAVPAFTLTRLLPGTDWELAFTLGADCPALAANRALAPGVATDWPMLKLMLNPHAASYGYSGLEKLRLTGIDVAVQVTGLATLQMSTPTGVVAPGKPFAPFGNAPLPGANWTLYHPELGCKQLDWVNINIDWLNLPLLNTVPQPPGAPNGFPQYYDGYQPYTFDNAGFQVALATFRDGAWQAPLVGDGAPAAWAMFSCTDGNVLPASVWSMHLGGRGAQAAAAPAGTPLNAAVAGPVAAPPGSVQVSFAAPHYGFGQALYPQMFAACAIQNMLLVERQARQDNLWRRIKACWAALWHRIGIWLQRAGALVKAVIAWLLHLFGKGAAMPQGTPPAPAAGPTPAPALPLMLLNMPFVPTIKNVSLSYHARETLTLDGAQPQFYHVHPFGLAAPRETSLFPLALDDGNCYIGLLNAAPGQALSMHVEMRAPAASCVSLGGAAPARPGLTWRYLADDAWREFEADSVSSPDYDAGVSGIVRLSLPPLLGGGARLMGASSKPPLAWIAVGTSDSPADWAATVAILPQAVRARRVTPQGTDGAVLAAGSIKALSPAVAQVRAVSQPYASTGGQAPEQREAFRLRASERLRHKQRASVPRDYEQLVLDAFPGVWQVKCIGPNNSFGSGRLGSGELALVLVPPIQARPEQAAPFAATQLSRIGLYVQSLASACVRKIDVRNVCYEVLEVTAAIDFASDADVRQCIAQLTQALQEFLSPWQREHAPHLAIGCGTVPVSGIAALLLGQAGVRAIRSLSVAQRMPGPQSMALVLHAQDSARPRLPWSVLVPAATHVITQATAEAACC
ncbi:Baseplate J-like protein [Janthinobacterium sp. 344]|nr:Baseplate J-like protein [Janthinobacterium sp. 551a]SFB29011.1 Baseplate J-like protein [Janthinobacterium sp. 344]